MALGGVSHSYTNDGFTTLAFKSSICFFFFEFVFYFIHHGCIKFTFN